MQHFEDPVEDNPNFPCKICNKIITRNKKHIRCNICNFKLHIKCNKTDEATYQKMKRYEETMICIKCNENNLPFFNMSQETNNETLSISPSNNSIKLFFKGINELMNNQNIIDDDNIPPINCNYEDINSFNYKNNTRDLSLFHLNIASLGKHKEELETILTMLKAKFDVIGITETKIKINIVPIFDTSLDGYAPYQTPTEGDKGGVTLYISKKHKCKRRKDLDSIIYKTKELESVFVELIRNNKKNIIIGCIYRHPNMEISEFNEYFINPLMNKLSKEDKTFFLLGDFNIDLLKIDIENNITNFFDILTSNLVVPHIILPTRITPTSKTLIDNIYSNSLNFLQGTSGNFTFSISDHLAQFLIIAENYGHIPSKSNFFKRDTKNFDKENFLLETSKINWDSVINTPKEDPNFSYNSFEKTLNSIIDKYIPLKKITKKEIKLKCKPWITKGIRKSIQRREKLYKKFIKSKNQKSKDEFHQNYKELRNHIVTIIRESKKLHFKKYFTENINNIQKTWKGIKSVININNSIRSEPSCILSNNNLITEPKEIANNFNNYFANIGQNLQSKIYQKDLNYKDYLTQSNDYSFFIKPTDKGEIINIINNININKATGPHSIPSDILHVIKNYIADPLSKIINLSFVKGIYIDNLKIAKTIPIFKDKGSNLDCSNYRPISLLSNINKIIEKLMHSRLYNFLSIHNCIYDHQFGFRKNHSTNHALLNLTEEIRDALDNNSFAAGVFVDLQKAFDTVDHTILLNKLNYYGIRGLANNWFKSYLSNRKQYVSINGFESDVAIMKYGVPQGSVLGPLLFIIYINDLNSAIKYCSIRHFADDTNLLITNKNLKQLNKQMNLDLRNLNKWLKANKISLNASKTELLVFRHPNKKFTYDLKLKLNGKRLLPSKFVKYLGLILDSHLNWRFHTDILASKLTRSIGMLCKIRHYVDSNTLRSIYYGIFSSLMTYGSQNWGQFQNKYVNRILKLQDKAIRIINFGSSFDSRNPLYLKSKIIKFSDNIKLLNFIFVYDSLKNNLPTILNNNFTQVNKYHNHNTRYAIQNTVALPKIKTQIYGIKSIKFQSSSSWNFFVGKYSSKKLFDQTKSFCKNIITQNFLENYKD